MAKWNNLARRIELYRARTGDRSDFSVASGSSLSHDDEATSPYQLSHAVRLCLVAGIDHLDAMRQLIVADRTLHIAAPFSLARGALEMISAAFWILHPAAKDERITRLLRWHVKNCKDEREVAKISEVAPPPYLESKRRNILEIGQRQRLRRDLIEKGYTSTAAVRYAGEESSVKVLLVWQLCSGYAHGRSWAYRQSDREEYQTADPTVHDVGITSSYSSTWLPARQTVQLLEEVLREYDIRSGGGFGAQG